MRPLTLFLLLAISLLLTSNQLASAQEATRGAHYVSKHAGRPRVVIFVHGFTGNEETSWRAPNPNPNGVSFPGLLATDSRIKQADVFVASYETRWTSENSTIIDLAKSLYEQLDRNGILKDYQDLVFICHSLGGLVVERMLLEHPDAAAKTSFIQFFGTPHQGAFSDKYDALIGLVGAFGRSSLIPELRPGSGNAVLVHLDEDWRKSHFDNIRRYCAIEDRDTEAGAFHGRVVDYFSGSSGCPGNIVIDIVQADHRNMVKPSDRTGPHNEAYGIFLRNYIQNPYRQVKTYSDDSRISRHYFAVDCNHTQSDLAYPVPFVLDPQLKEELVGATAELVDGSNIQGVDPNPPQATKVGPATVNVRYGFNGSDKDWKGDCPGGGHATLVVHPIIKAQVPIFDGE